VSNPRPESFQHLQLYMLSLIFLRYRSRLWCSQSLNKTNVLVLTASLVSGLTTLTASPTPDYDGSVSLQVPEGEPGRLILCGGEFLSEPRELNN
jgi:hypothetical protein